MCVLPPLRKRAEFTQSVARTQMSSHNGLARLALGWSARSRAAQSWRQARTQIGLRRRRLRRWPALARVAKSKEQGALVVCAAQNWHTTSVCDSLDRSLAPCHSVANCRQQAAESDLQIEPFAKWKAPLGSFWRRHHRITQPTLKAKQIVSPLQRQPVRAAARARNIARAMGAKRITRALLPMPPPCAIDQRYLSSGALLAIAIATATATNVGADADTRSLFSCNNHGPLDLRAASSRPRVVAIIAAEVRVAARSRKPEAP